MINLIRRDFDSNRWVVVLLCVTLGLGLLCWIPALTARHAAPQTPPDRTVISILPDPFDGQRK
jgi:hypothetical protein